MTCPCRLTMASGDVHYIVAAFPLLRFNVSGWPCWLHYQKPALNLFSTHRRTRTFVLFNTPDTHLVFLLYYFPELP